MAAKSNCSHSELIARVVAIETGLTALRQVLDERDERYKQRALSQDKAVSAALETSEKAIIKAESATERRFEGVNEFRATLADQAANLMPRSEYTVQHQALVEKVNQLQDRRIGMTQAWGYFVGIAGLVIAAFAIYFRH